jgi:ligand-binding SRPBCC domain-containing protein
MAFYQFQKKQMIPASLEEMWDFISSPKNLKEITPEYMGFEITSKNLTEKIYPGMIIRYKVKPFAGIPLTWVTEITHVVEKKYFIDEQRVGPYSFWHHQHILEQLEKGILMTDIVSYKPPLAILGSIANVIIIQKKLEAIFEYREKVLSMKFDHPKSGEKE